MMSVLRASLMILRASLMTGDSRLGASMAERECRRESAVGASPNARSQSAKTSVVSLLQ